ncbi:leucine carboxyl methyltransferase [Basidiobolus meristosporus CBS 931.73]|uniref:Leucine carboxyl methyltransferase 1 n=1 Tax=Basidiobolus meristosporus CBS 931.73 TaxID=1314790 RepID=A0A1Y1YQG8_9FUNG|nr:leucine carboxyl methyltransferase [Basidiobolus meristosporus CBS 931.73]|eukprot:ORY00206.1 leucine carboxyl methyltransferase [Basidiobolus meristosporus CBS 931.73]
MSFGTSRPNRNISNDEAVRGTNDDATISKLSAVNLGYLEDKFARYFVKRGTRRPPIINRGSFVRTRFLDSLLQLFIDSSTEKKQVVSLGAGSDTRYFLLKEAKQNPHLYIEIDFPEVTSRKLATIYKNPELKRLLPEDAKLGNGGTELYSSDYILLSGDLRRFTEDLVPRLQELGCDFSLPTMFLSECVLIYLDPIYSDKIVLWAVESAPKSMFVTYEQILPDDPFGQMMIRNLELRDIKLRGLHAYPDLASQEERYLQKGWRFAKALDIQELHEHYISSSEKARIAKLEFLDELEEWNLLAKHYCIAYALTFPEESKEQSPFKDICFQKL